MGVIRTKVKDYNIQKKSRHQSITESSRSTQKNTDENLNEQSTDYLPDTTKPQTRHRTTKEEMEILSELKVYKDKLPDDAITSVRERLPDIWSKKKVREWWNYHKDK